MSALTEQQWSFMDSGGENTRQRRLNLTTQFQERTTNIEQNVEAEWRSGILSMNSQQVKDGRTKWRWFQDRINRSYSRSTRSIMNTQMKWSWVTPKKIQNKKVKTEK
jgi:hypothetical protein